MIKLRRWRLPPPLALLGLVPLMMVPLSAQALPSFARQTGLACLACHNSNFPELNAFGRQFKLNGYALAMIKEIQEKGNGIQGGSLGLINIPLLSAMFQVSMTRMNNPPTGTQNNDVQFPQQVSLFLAGRVAPHMGMFVQMTHAQGDGSGFSMDNADIRYANQANIAGKPTVYGVTVNNSPTVEDLWNSTPTWGYPWSSPPDGVAADPAAATLIDGGLGQSVAGLGGYAMWDNTLYGAVTAYRKSTGSATINGGEVKGVAPYWRLAWQHNFGAKYLMIGTYGIDADLYSSSVGGGGPTSNYLDTAVDMQYEQPLGREFVTVHSTLIHEKRKDAAANGAYMAGVNSTLNTFKLDGSLHFGAGLRPTLAYFQTTTSGPTNTGTDNLDNRGYIAQLSYFPWQNVNLTVQYIGYTKFDGTTTNASDNNTLLLLGWLVF